MLTIPTLRYSQSDAPAVLRSLNNAMLVAIARTLLTLETPASLPQQRIPIPQSPRRAHTVHGIEPKKRTWPDRSYRALLASGETDISTLYGNGRERFSDVRLQLRTAQRDAPLPFPAIRKRGTVRVLLHTLVLVCLLCFSSIFVSSPAIADTHPGEYVSPTIGSPLWPIVTRPFDRPATRYGSGHRGVDVAAPPGSPVVASGDGIVRFAGLAVGQPTVSIYHADDIITTYLPVIPDVVPGQPVVRGQTIGIVARVPSLHSGLHWGAKTGPNSYMNPLHLLHDPRIRVIPTPPDIELRVREQRQLK